MMGAGGFIRNPRLDGTDGSWSDDDDFDIFEFALNFQFDNDHFNFLNVENEDEEMNEDDQDEYLPSESGHSEDDFDSEFESGSSYEVPRITLHEAVAPPEEEDVNSTDGEATDVA